jgi:rare lipoprotein A
VGDIADLFGYAEVPDGNAAINGAVAAATAMGTRDRALADWVSVVDQDALAIRLQLGEFEDAAQAERVADAFAMLGAVDPEDVTIGGRPALRLTLTHLKPGVARADVLALTRELGLTDIVLY